MNCGPFGTAVCCCLWVNGERLTCVRCITHGKPVQRRKHEHGRFQ